MAPLSNSPHGQRNSALLPRQATNLGQNPSSAQRPTALASVSVPVQAHTRSGQHPNGNPTVTTGQTTRLPQPEAAHIPSPPSAYYQTSSRSSQNHDQQDTSFHPTTFEPRDQAARPSPAKLAHGSVSPPDATPVVHSKPSSRRFLQSDIHRQAEHASQMTTSSDTFRQQSDISGPPSALRPVSSRRPLRAGHDQHAATQDTHPVSQAATVFSSDSELRAMPKPSKTADRETFKQIDSVALPTQTAKRPTMHQMTTGPVPVANVEDTHSKLGPSNTPRVKPEDSLALKHSSSIHVSSSRPSESSHPKWAGAAMRPSDNKNLMQSFANNTNSGIGRSDSRASRSIPTASNDPISRNRLHDSAKWQANAAASHSQPYPQRHDKQQQRSSTPLLPPTTPRVGVH